MPHDVPSRGLLAAVLAASADVIVVIDAGGQISYANDAAARVLGRPPELWIGRSVIGLIHPDDRPRMTEWLADAFARPDELREPVRFRSAHAEGHWVTLEASGTRRIELPDADGIVVVIRDVTQRVQAEQRLREACRELDHAVSHDPLTMLPNREVLQARLAAMARRLGAGDQPAHLVMVKVCELDEIRYEHGVDETTAILRKLAGAIAHTVSAAEFVAVDGIGEFVVVVDDGRSAAEADELARELLALADAPLSSRGQRVDIRLSAGIAVLHHGRPAPVALDQVGQAANRGRNGMMHVPVFFDPSLDHQVSDQRRAANAVQAALADGELELWYQPILDVRSGTIKGFEGLLRWIQPDGRVVSAQAFLPEVEGSAVMIDIGDFVVTEGCAQLARWQREHGPDAPSLALNVSARQLRRGDFAARVADEVSRSGADPAGLCLELTETHALEREPAAVAELGLLRDRGVRLGLDDFGTGYSSLHHLHELRADVLKIDRAFIDRLGRDTGATAIVRASVELGAAFGMVTVAEGVTSVAQREQLRAMGCDRIQGFLAAPAVPADTASTMLGAMLPSLDGSWPDIPVTIARARRSLAGLDEAYRPSDAEIAALAGVRLGEVRRNAAPPRFEPLVDDRPYDRTVCPLAGPDGP